VHSFPTQFGFEIALVPKPCHTLWALNQLFNSTCPVHIELYQHPPSSGQTFMKLIYNLMVDIIDNCFDNSRNYVKFTLSHIDCGIAMNRVRIVHPDRM
jgi:hypothetical protein